MNFNKYVNSVDVKDDGLYIELLKEKNFLYPVLGVITPEINQKLIVKKVFSNSPAEKAGFELNDVIVNFNGSLVKSAEQFLEILRQVNHGDEVPAVVMRDGRIVNLIVSFPSASELEELKRKIAEPQFYHDNLDIERKLTELKNLLNKGLISKDEYMQKKKVILENY